MSRTELFREIKLLSIERDLKTLLGGKNKYREYNDPYSEVNKSDQVVSDTAEATIDLSKSLSRPELWPHYDLL